MEFVAVPNCSGVAVFLHDSTCPALLPCMLVFGVLGGMLWAGIPALLKTRFNANEILVSLMLVYVAELLLVYLVHGPWRNPQGWGFPGTRNFPDAAVLPLFSPQHRLHWGLFAALVAPFIAWFIVAKSRFGFRVRLFGSAPLAARHAGVKSKRMIWSTLLIGGALAGLAGVIEASGTIGQLMPNISPGYGFTAIIVAFLGRLHPIGIVFAGLLVALTYLGGDSAQITMNLPNAVTGVFQGMLLFF